MIELILKELFENFTILIAILFLYTTFTGPLYSNSPVKNKIWIGILGGVLCNILMQYSIQVGSSFIMDLRHVPIFLLSYYGGILPAAIAMILTIVGRLLIGVNSSALASVLFIIFSTIFSLLVTKSYLSKRMKIFLMLTFSNLLFSVITYFCIKDRNIVEVILSYWAISYLAGYIAFYTVRFLRQRKLLFDKYRSESMIDGLTGLHNFRKFDDLFTNLVNDLKTGSESLSLLYIDIDFFKKINDTYGHYEGDVVLKELGMILQNCTKSFDTVSRNGGEEFTALLPNCKLTDAMKIAEKIRKTVEAYEFTLNSGQVIKLTVSIGVSSYPDTTDYPFMLIEDADKALYRAKKSGRNRVCFAIKKDQAVF